MLAEGGAQAGRESLSRKERFAQTRVVELRLPASVEEDLQKRRGPDVPVGFQVRNRRGLQLRLSHTGREDPATQSPGARVDHDPRRREVVGKRVVDELAPAKPGGVERAAEARVVGPMTFELIDRPRRREDMHGLSGRDNGEAAQRRVAALQLGQLRLAEHGKAGERSAVDDFRSLDAVEPARPGGAGARELDLAGQTREELRLALLRRAGL